MSISPGPPGLGILPGYIIITPLVTDWKPNRPRISNPQTIPNMIIQVTEQPVPQKHGPGPSENKNPGN